VVQFESGIPPCKNQVQLRGELPLYLAMPSDNRDETEEVRQTAEENRRTIERLREEVRNLRARVEREQPQPKEKTNRAGQ
jgi:molecular chaperone GrpE (heat shock protein)